MIIEHSCSCELYEPGMVVCDCQCHHIVAEDYINPIVLFDEEEFEVV